MEWLKYLFIPFLMSALLTPILKKIAYRLDIYAEMNERTIHQKKFHLSAEAQSMWLLLSPLQCSLKAMTLLNLS